MIIGTTLHHSTSQSHHDGGYFRRLWFSIWFRQMMICRHPSCNHFHRLTYIHVILCVLLAGQIAYIHRKFTFSLSLFAFGESQKPDKTRGRCGRNGQCSGNGRSLVNDLTNAHLPPMEPQMHGDESGDEVVARSRNRDGDGEGKTVAAKSKQRRRG
ncbi:hypothetical protein HanPSC8_Chr08g0334161 [Helianthus annuus]|nr:hypothetical protein HanPSC8_Chr08g0334161 [Helianthus annuus]